jgi:ubiquinone/menaquinone biosynthesis C-methylase UbiE
MGAMNARSVDRAYLRYQYDDAEKLRIRFDTHARYSERTGDTFASWLLERVHARPGQTLLDVGCGPGHYHGALADSGVRLTGVDPSRGMLREARAQAATGGYTLAAAMSDAQSLPFRDASFDIVMANHMLYHVADQGAALGELRRVLKPGGRAVMATNGADNFAQLDALHRSAATRLGYTASAHDALRFTLDDLPLVRSVFPSAELSVRTDAFMFPDAAPALRFYATYAIDSIEGRPADGSHRAALLREMGDAIDAIVTREGVFRVAKTAGCFVAVV